jgi:citrate lyase subunit beta/citryl-CoA lyase
MFANHARELKMRSWLVSTGLPADDIIAKTADRLVINMESALARASIRVTADESGRERHVAWLPALSSPQAENAVALAVKSGIDTVILPAVRGCADVQRLAMLLRLQEARHGVSDGHTRVVALLDASGLLQAADFCQCSRRLSAIGLDRLDPHIDEGSTTAEFARAQLVLAARAVGIAAIASAPSSQDPNSFRAACVDLRNNGFSGLFVSDPDQVEIVNGIF